jgi:hypothetical protein
MTRINSLSLSNVSHARLGDQLAQPQPPSAGGNTPLSQALQQPRSLQLGSQSGISAFESIASAISSGSGGITGDIRNRLNNVLSRIPGHMSTADQIATQLTPQEQRLLMTAPPELQAQIRQQIQLRQQATAQQLRGQAASVNRPFSPLETQAQMGQAAQALKDNVNKTFDLYLRELGTLPLNLHQRYQLQTQIEQRRAAALQSIDSHTAHMGRSGASFQDVSMGRQMLEQDLDMATRDLNSQLLSMLPPERQGQVRAELELQRMGQAQAVYNHFSRALQPSSPTEFNQLPGGAPPMRGPLTQAQAKSTLQRLEAGIQQQYQARAQAANTLPPELRQQAMFEATMQRDRMLVSAYRNVLGRVTPDVVLPPPPPPPVVLR